MDSRIKTPCLGMCSTTYGDLVCRGCRRFAHEVRDWNRYEAQHKLAVLSRLEWLQVSVAREVICVDDPDRLWQACESLKVRGARPDFDPLVWACELLRMGGSHITRLSDFGISAMPAWQSRPIGDLADWLTQTLYTRAEAEYDRQFGRKLTF